MNGSATKLLHELVAPIIKSHGRSISRAAFLLIGGRCSDQPDLIFVGTYDNLSGPMDDERGNGTKRKWFLWGMTLALIAFIPTIFGTFNSFRGISENKATGLAAVAGGLTEAYAALGLILTLMLPVAAIVLLGKSLSRLHPMRAWLSWLSIFGSVLVLVLSGLSIWLLFIHTSQAASFPR